RRASSGARELAIMQEAHAGKSQDQQRSGAMFLKGQERRDTRFIVIFEEMCAAGDQRARALQEMLLNASGITSDQAVIQSLVVGEIKAEFEQARLQAPVGLRQKKKFPVNGLDRGN